MDQDRINQFLIEHRRNLHSLVSCALNGWRLPIDEADDLVQILTERFSRVSRYHYPPEEWSKVLFSRTTLQRLIQDYKRRRNRQIPAAISLDKATCYTTLSTQSSEEATSAAQLMEVALAKLSPQDRLLITARKIEARKYSEIATMLGISEAAAMARFKRAWLRVEGFLHEHSTTNLAEMSDFKRLPRSRR